MMLVKIFPNHLEDPVEREKYRMGEVVYANSSLAKIGDDVFFDKSAGVRFHEGHYYGIEDSEVVGFITHTVSIQKHE